MSRRNNIKILDLPKEEGKNTWADTEELVKKTIKEQLHYACNGIEIENEASIDDL